jgi:hypothetical protein
MGLEDALDLNQLIHIIFQTNRIEGRIYEVVAPLRCYIEHIISRVGSIFYFKMLLLYSKDYFECILQVPLQHNHSACFHIEFFGLCIKCYICRSTLHQSSKCPNNTTKGGPKSREKVLAEPRPAQRALQLANHQTATSISSEWPTKQPTKTTTFDSHGEVASLNLAPIGTSTEDTYMSPQPFKDYLANARARKLTYNDHLEKESTYS